MADTENRNIDFKDASKESVKADKSHNEKKPHKKKSFAWWAGVIVLILISITFILPATGISSLFVDSSIEFGSYGGEPIEYANGSDMYNQYSSLYMQYGGLMEMATTTTKTVFLTSLYTMPQVSQRGQASTTQ